jgi:hypothetical protein
MTRTILGSALALPLISIATPALAQEPTSDEEIVALGHRPDAHGPAGVMGDHIHNSGELMIGLEWMHMRHAGATQSGSDPISDADIVAAGYSARTQGMTMDMAMLHIMYAPDDTLTFTLMPSWNRMEMTMLGIDPMATGGGGGGHGGHGGHAMAFGETMTHAVSGIGDTRAGVAVALSRDSSFGAHAGLELSIPTGKSGVKNDDGTFVHYGMQPGSGTWDLEPSLTLRGMGENISWGLQAKYLVRLEDANKGGFAFGDRLTANGWLSTPLGRSVSLSARLGFTSEGPVEGHYNGPHNHSAPPDRQPNYGGEIVEAGIGANVVVGEGLRLGGEVTLPLYQDFNGIQLPRDWGLNISLSKMF